MAPPARSRPGHDLDRVGDEQPAASRSAAHSSPNSERLISVGEHDADGSPSSGSATARTPQGRPCAADRQRAGDDPVRTGRGDGAARAELDQGVRGRSGRERRRSSRGVAGVDGVGQRAPAIRSPSPVCTSSPLIVEAAAHGRHAEVADGEAEVDRAGSTCQVPVSKRVGVAVSMVTTMARARRTHHRGVPLIALRGTR